MRNAYEVKGAEAVIYVYGKGEVRTCRVSIRALEKLKTVDCTWYARQQRTGDFYVMARIGKDKVLLHRFLTEAAKTDLIDHIDRDTLNNTDDNLRKATRRLNSLNSKLRKDNTTGVKGICYNKGRRKPWQVLFKVDGKRKSFGYYSDLEEAKVVATRERQRLGIVD